MLALMAAAAGELTVTSYRFEQHALVAARAGTILDGAIQRAVLGIYDTRPQARWRVDGALQIFDFDGQRAHVAVQDELGRIDLNAASGSLLRQLFLAAGLQSDAASSMTDRISDWRSASGLRSLHGGSDADYADAGRTYNPRHGPFQTVEELKLVLGMTPALFEKVAPALTVYSKRAAFDPDLAPRQALAALYPDNPLQVEHVLRSRKDVSEASSTAGRRPGVLSTAITLGGRTFSIMADVTIGHRNFKRYAVVELTGDDKRPFFVLAWK